MQSISDDDDTVLSFSVTTRSKRFRPTFEVPAGMSWRKRRRWLRHVGERFRPLFRVQLGGTRLADIDPDRDAGRRFKVDLGARYFCYSEFHYFGNPGYYQTFVFTAGGAGIRASIGDIPSVIQEIGGNEWPDPDGNLNEVAWQDMPATQQFRHDTVITTYTVIGPGLWEANYPSRFGPHGDEVRTLP